MHQNPRVSRLRFGEVKWVVSSVRKDFPTPESSFISGNLSAPFFFFCVIWPNLARSVRSSPDDLCLHVLFHRPCEPGGFPGPVVSVCNAVFVTPDWMHANTRATFQAYSPRGFKLYREDVLFSTFTSFLRVCASLRDGLHHWMRDF